MEINPGFKSIQRKVYVGVMVLGMKAQQIFSQRNSVQIFFEKIASCLYLLLDLQQAGVNHDEARQESIT